ncbi:FeoA family protein [Chloracidobacterium thermophilum]|uniref:FeoA family protein n=1 Tax=Chloracidobacterium thermophilum TaxID=458033 RepID=UPI000738C04D|nr:FeoA family protein [Chloracidobacterium thermophilum]
MKRWLAALRPSSATSATPQTLADVPAGERVRVRRLLDMDGAENLRERGLCETSEVRVIADGDPLVCSVLGVRMTLNRHTAQGILVERLP